MKQRRRTGIASENKMVTPITGEDEWLSALRFARRWRPEIKRALVLSPHPDDEVLGAGGIMADLCRSNIPVTVLAVTDGEAAYPGTSGLGPIRQLEQEKALGRIGVSRRDITRLRIPDGGVALHEDRLVGQLQDILCPETLLFAPWRLDPHPDHEACGRAAARAARISGNSLASYLFWTWHRQAPAMLLDTNPRCFDLDPRLCAAKASALASYRSQLEWKEGEPILPDLLLAPARRPFETFIIHD
jgi:LmbE family N-acetylglucosaminyl deacetylase